MKSGYVLEYDDVVISEAESFNQILYEFVPHPYALNSAQSKQPTTLGHPAAKCLNIYFLEQVLLYDSSQGSADL